MSLWNCFQWGWSWRFLFASPCFLLLLRLLRVIHLIKTHLRHWSDCFLLFAGERIRILLLVVNIHKGILLRIIHNAYITALFSLHLDSQLLLLHIRNTETIRNGLEDDCWRVMLPNPQSGPSSWRVGPVLGRFGLSRSEESQECDECPVGTSPSLCK